MTYRSLENTIRFGTVSEEKEKDSEGQMARAQLQMIAKRAAVLAEMMNDDTQLEAWVQSKITTAEDYVTTVHDYMTTRKGN
jgi:hypothetical protein